MGLRGCAESVENRMCSSPRDRKVALSSPSLLIGRDACADTGSKLKVDRLLSLYHVADLCNAIIKFITADFAGLVVGVTTITCDLELAWEASKQCAFGRGGRQAVE